MDLIEYIVAALLLTCVILQISSCVNGTGGESQSRPVPSNRRGRMKGKYAPLPRSMEENIPRHDD